VLATYRNWVKGFPRHFALDRINAIIIAIPTRYLSVNLSELFLTACIDTANNIANPNFNPKRKNNSGELTDCPPNSNHKSNDVLTINHNPNTDVTTV